ncbi:MAG: hypothetical protein DHS20C17_06600 [Cyclobacteriaceae bacterium]|nr:MAG: hypothetical protein DHS20C17_06600 [Cyclobacteriaceae bacterium]
METNEIKIVIVEDDHFYGELLRKYVTQVVEGIFPHYSGIVRHHISAPECVENLDRDTRLFILDYNLTGEGDSGQTTGVDLLEIVKEECPTAQVIVVTQHSDFATINKFARLGADRYILKDQDTPLKITAALRQLLEQKPVSTL